MPGAGGIDDRFACRERYGQAPAVNLLVQSHAPSRADDKLAARGMHLPGIPRHVKGMHRDETSFATVCGVPLTVFAIPFDSSEAGLTLDPGAKAQVGREFLELKYRQFVRVGKLQNYPQAPTPKGRTPQGG